MPYAAPLHRPNAPRKGQQHQRNRQQTRAMHTGSKAWRAIRAQVLERDQYTCRVCGKFGDQVDHVDGDSNHNPADGSNWQTLCHADHSAKTMREQHAAGFSRVEP